MTVIVVGAGIGGLTAALSLHEAGFDVRVFEQARELAELGVGLNLLPHATKALDALGLLTALDEAGIRTRELVYATRFGQDVWTERRGMYAGYGYPQFSIHRGMLHGVLARSVLRRLGADRVSTGSVFVGYQEHNDEVVVHLQQRADGKEMEVRGDVLVGCDGIHSAVRRALYPYERPPIWSGIWLWRGALDWPAFRGGDTMIIAGGMASRFVCYPIHANPATPDRRLTNWAVMARLGQGATPSPRPEDWNRRGDRDEALRFVRDRFRLAAIDPVAMIDATEDIYEYPNCDRDPLPRWSFGRVTLLGDAAHPMYPVGSNGASQAILDARALARHLASGMPAVNALAAYDAERRPLTADIVKSNRQGGNERVIDIVEARAPDGFEDIEAIASHAEREQIVAGYSRIAGFAPEQVNHRWPSLRRSSTKPMQEDD